jgi:hypothetical protein
MLRDYAFAFFASPADITSELAGVNLALMDRPHGQSSMSRAIAGQLCEIYVLRGLWYAELK